MMIIRCRRMCFVVMIFDGDDGDDEGFEIKESWKMEKEIYENLYQSIACLYSYILSLLVEWIERKKKKRKEKKEKGGCWVENLKSLLDGANWT